MRELESAATVMRNQQMEPPAVAELAARARRRRVRRGMAITCCGLLGAAAAAVIVPSIGDEPGQRVDVVRPAEDQTTSDPASTLPDARPPTESSTTPPTQPSTTPPTTAPTDSSSTTATMPVPLDLAAAERAMLARGYKVIAGADEYDPRAPLSVLIGVRRETADGLGRYAFFFHEGRLLGTDTSEESAAVTLVGQTGQTVTLSYPLYRPGDGACCPSGGTARVRFRWNGSRVEPLDPIPPAQDPNGPGRTICCNP